MKKFAIYIIILITAFAVACEKEITVDLPKADDKIVVEGFIETGLPPIVIVSRNMSYFDPVDTNTYENLLVDDATVVVTHNGVSDTLFYFFPVYTTFSIIGEVGEIYDLTVIADNKTLTATTRIPEPVAVDSIRFKLSLSPEMTEQYNDSIGFIWMYATDPDTLGNCYRIFTKTTGISRKDEIFVTPTGSVTDDQYFNGQLIEFGIENGENPYEELIPDETDSDTSYVHPPRYYFRYGDTVLLKLASIDPIHYNFWYTVEQQMGTDGNPFASPTTVQTNIKGDGLGIWGGYGTFIDTVIITPEILLDN